MWSVGGIAPPYGKQVIIELNNYALCLENLETTGIEHRVFRLKVEIFPLGYHCLAFFDCLKIFYHKTLVLLYTEIYYFII